MSRVFISVPISESLQLSIATWQNSHGALPVRWVAGKNLHVTLVPPWEERDVRSVIDRLQSVRLAPFDIHIRTVSFGPDQRQPRLIWAEGSAPAQIEDLRHKIYNALGKTPEPRPFRMHVTLARIQPEDFKSLSHWQLHEIVDWYEQVESFVLMQTHRTPKGSDYEVLAEFPLQVKAQEP